MAIIARGEKSVKFLLNFTNAIQVQSHFDANKTNLWELFSQKPKKSPKKVRMAVTDKFVVLDKPLWWSDTEEKRLSYEQLRDVYVDGKKIALDIQLDVHSERRIVIFKLESEGEALMITGHLRKRKIAVSTYSRSNMHAIQYSDWVSTVQVDPDYDIEDDLASLYDDNEYDYYDNKLSRGIATGHGLNLARTPMIDPALHVPNVIEQQPMALRLEFTQFDPYMMGNALQAMYTNKSDNANYAHLDFTYNPADYSSLINGPHILAKPKCLVKRWWSDTFLNYSNEAHDEMAEINWTMLKTQVSGYMTTHQRNLTNVDAQKKKHKNKKSQESDEDKLIYSSKTKAQELRYHRVTPLALAQIDENGSRYSMITFETCT